MRILHTADWHLGKIFHEHSLLEDQRLILDRILEHIQTTEYDIMLIAGDIHDRAIPPAEAVSLLSEFLRKLRGSHPDLKVFIIPGNHDSARRLAYGDEIFALSGIHFHTDPLAVDRPVTIGPADDPVNIYGIPFLFPGTYSDHAREGEAPRRGHDQVTAQALEKINAVKNDAEWNVLVAHLFTVGGQESESERTYVGTAGHVPASIFDGFDYTALGHLHKPQRVRDNVWYSGSPMKYSFSEAEHAKGLLSIELKRDGAGAKTIQVERVPLEPARDMRRLKGAFEEFLNGTAFDEYVNDYLEIELTDDDIVMNPAGLLNKKFPFLLAVRQQAARKQTSGLAGRKSAGGVNPEQDFAAFYEYLHGEKPAGGELQLFREIRRVGAGETAEGSESASGGREPVAAGEKHETP